MEAIAIGSTIIGVSGKKLVVDRVEGDIIHSGVLRIDISAVVSVEPLSLLDRLLLLDSLVKQDAIDELTSILLDFDVNSIYESSLDLHTFAGIFIRRLLADISPWEFEAIGKDGSEGKYGIYAYPNSPPSTSLLDDGNLKVGYRVTHTDLYHRRGADVGMIELIVIDSFGDCHVRWDSDSHVKRYLIDNLKPIEVVM
jgi:hypothetical protein